MQRQSPLFRYTLPRTSMTAIYSSFCVPPKVFFSMYACNHFVLQIIMGLKESARPSY